MPLPVSLTSNLNRYLFTDTQVHKRNNYWYRGGPLKQLQDNCESHGIRTITPDVILREMKSQIEKQSNDSLGSLKSVIKDSPWIGDIIEIGLDDVKTIKEAVGSKCYEDLTKFLEKSRNLLLKNDSSSLDDALNAYFTGTSPFKGIKNRDDIPDALAFFSLKNYCETNRTRISVITLDKALHKAFAQYPDLFSTFTDIDQYLKNVAFISDSEATAYQGLIEDHYDLFSDTVADGLDDIRIEVNHREYEVEKSMITEMDLTSCDVANVYHDGFSASFTAGIKAVAEVAWYEHDFDAQGPSYKRYGVINEEHTIGGYLRVYLTPDSDQAFEVVIDSMDSSVTLEGEAQEDHYDND